METSGKATVYQKLTVNGQLQVSWSVQEQILHMGIVGVSVFRTHISLQFFKSHILE